jgi:hypothetical protein
VACETGLRDIALSASHCVTVCRSSTGLVLGYLIVEVELRSWIQKPPSGGWSAAKSAPGEGLQSWEGTGNHTSFCWVTLGPEGHQKDFLTQMKLVSGDTGSSQRSCRCAAH